MCHHAASLHSPSLCRVLPFGSIWPFNPNLIKLVRIPAGVIDLGYRLNSGCIPRFCSRGHHTAVRTLYAAANRTGHQFRPVVQGSGEEDEREGEDKLLSRLDPDAGSPDV